MDRRTQIQKAAFELMADSGLESVHARTVADKLGINHATVHYYFRTRPELLVGVADYALAQLARDRVAIGASADAREEVENELALVEAYCRPSSRMANVIIALCAAQRGEPSLKEPVASLTEALLEPVKVLTKAAKTRKSSPFGEGDLLPELLLGLLLTAHLRGSDAVSEASFDLLHELLFKPA